MAERATLQITIYECPAEGVPAVLEILAEHDVRPEFADTETENALHTAIPYIDVEADLGEEDRLAAALIASVPQCSFVTWQDPKYECDGQIVMYHPALGRFDGCCNAFGEPHVSIGAVWAIAAECGVDRGAVTAAAFLDALSRRLGQPWRAIMADGDHRVIVPATGAAA